MDYDIRVANPTIDDKDIESVVKALKEKRLSSGKYAEIFEKKFAEFIGVKHAVSMNSASSALLVMLEVGKIGKDDEVITTPYTYAATANVIMLQGAKPVFVDIENESYNIDPTKIEEKITSKTKAIMPIHFGGQSAEMEPIRKIAQDAGLLVFEDAAPAAGATYQNEKVGGIGDAGAFSFFPDKNMTTGEGGMLTTNSDKIAEKARILKKNGAKERYHHTEIGWNFKMPDPSAALGISQLEKLPFTIKEKNKLAENYTKIISEEIEGVITPKTKQGCLHTFNLYSVRFANKTIRDRVKKCLEENKIETRICFPPVHTQPIFMELLKTKKGDFPISEKSAETSLCLPMYSDLTSDNQSKITSHIKEAIEMS